MTNRQVYRRIIIPNAAVVATPTLINSLIGLTKGTSPAFSASVVEIFAQARIIGERFEVILNALSRYRLFTGL